jgi:hypothetical protein
VPASPDRGSHPPPGRQAPSPAPATARQRQADGKARMRGQKKSFVFSIRFAISQQPSIGGHQEAAKLEHQAAVEIQPNSIRSRFTPWVRHGRLARSRVRC